MSFFFLLLIYVYILFNVNFNNIIVKHYKESILILYTIDILSLFLINYKNKSYNFHENVEKEIDYYILPNFFQIMLTQRINKI